MKTKASKPRKALSFALAFLMVLSVGLMDWSALIFKADAASTKTADKVCGDLSFWAPEAIYLYPNGESDRSATSTPFQYYVNNNSDGSVKTSYDTTGYIYFSYATASNTTLTYRFMNGSFSTLSGGSITLNATSGLGTSKTVSITAGTSPSLAATTNGCWIEWTLSFTDTKDNVTKKAYAYTYVYKPYIVPVGGFTRVKNSDGNSHYCASATWMTGVHSITVGSLHDNGGYYPNRNGTYGLGGFMTAGDTAYVGTTSYSTGYGSRQESCWTDCNYWTSGAGKRKFAFINTGTSAGSYIKTDPNNTNSPSYGSTSSSTSTYSVRSMDYWYTDGGGEYNRLAKLYSGASGNIHIDTSRYSNLKDIPNLAVACMLTDNQGSKWGCWYMADASGVSSNRSTGTHTGAGSCRDVYNSKNYVLAACGDSATNDSSTDSWDEEGVQYGGPWVRTTLGSTGTQNGTYTYSIRSWFTQEEDSKGTNDWAYNTCLVDLNATYHNKANLRAAVERAIKKMPALGVNGISSGLPSSCYFDSNTDYKWTAFRNAYKAAVIALGQLDNSNNMDTLATNLNNALNALCTKVTFNANGGTLTGTTPQYVTIGTNQTVSVTPSSLSVSVNAREGYDFLGWSTSSTSATGAASVTVGYNQTLYAVWKKHTSTLTVDPNTGTWGGTTSATTQTKDFYTVIDIPIPTKDGWTFTSWTKSSPFYGVLSSLTGAGTYKYPVDDGVTSSIKANWTRTITNTYYYLDGNASYTSIQKSQTTSTTNGSTPETTVSITSPNDSEPTLEYTKNDKTWTLKGWSASNVTSAVHGGATQTAAIGFNQAQSMSTNASSYAFYPVYALKSTKFYANYNYYTDGATAAVIKKNVTVNGDATTGAMPVPTGSDNGSNADLARFYTNAGKIYELKGWSKTQGSNVVDIPYTVLDATATLNVPGAGTPTSTANLTPIELYPVYELYATAINTRFYYYKNNGASVETAFIPVSGEAHGQDTSGTVLTPGLDQVTTSYTDGGVTYTLLGWATTASSVAFMGPVTSTTVSVLEDAVNDYHHFYPVYSCVTTSRFYYFDASGNMVNTYKDKTSFKTDGDTPTQAVVAIPRESEINTTFTLDGRTFTFVGWRKDKTSAAQTIEPAVLNETLTIRDEEYKYYAVYRSDDLTLSYNGINGAPIPAAQKATQFLNAGLGNADTANASPFTFVINPDNVTPEKTGYTYIGWQDENNAEQESETYSKTGGTVTIKTNKVLYAVYQINDLDVNFRYWKNGGYVTDTKTVKYDDGTRSDSGAARYVATSVALDTTVIDHFDGDYHYYFSGWEIQGGDAVLTPVNTGTKISAKIGLALTDVNVNALYQGVSHHWVTVIDDDHPMVEPTCTQDGYYYHYCSDCGYEDYHAVIKAPGHAIAYEGYKAPTCTKDGQYAVAFCYSCALKSTDDGYDGAKYYELSDGKYVPVEATDRVIEKLGHAWEIDTTVGENGVVAPTCATKGYIAYVCANNAAHEKIEYTLPALEHVLVTEEGKEPTCTEAGYTASTKCSLCGSVIIDKKVLSATGHTAVIDPAVEPTCTEPGKTEGKHCSECGAVIVAQEEIAALGHDIVYVEPKEPTCTEDGWTAGNRCSRCDYGDDSVLIPAPGHTYVGEATVVPSTCTVPGTSTRYCSVCDADIVTELELAPHTEVTVPAREATCTEEGYHEYKKCSVCDQPLETVVKTVKVPHKLVVATPAVAAKCTEVGSTASYKCSVCQQIIVEAAEVAELGHKYGKEIITKQATCTEDGEKVQVCSRCGYEKVTVIDAGAHDYVAVAEVPATCAESGLTAGVKCSICGDVQSGCELIPATNEHQFGEYEIVKAPTCSAVGVKKHVCTVCEYVETEVMEMTEHSMVDVPAVEATCYSIGYTAGTRCSVCGYTEGHNAVAKKAHTEETRNKVDATCTDKGYSGDIYCSVCDTLIAKGRVTNALGHKTGEWTTVVIRDCTTDGVRERCCPVCGEEKETKILPALGHDMTYVPAKAPTCKDGNLDYYVCSRCDGKYYVDEAGSDVYADVVIPATGHVCYSSTVEATCTTDGYTYDTCIYCGKTEVTNTTEAFGHTGGTATCVSKAVCTVCFREYGTLKAHNYITETTTGNCCVMGTVTKKCSECGKIASVTETGYGEHAYDIKDAFYTVAPSCTEPGEYQVACYNCHEEVITVSVEPTGHQDEDEDGYCDVCGFDMLDGQGTTKGKCDKCGMNHGGKSGSLFGYDGFFCRLISFIRRLFGINK